MGACHNQHSEWRVPYNHARDESCAAGRAGITTPDPASLPATSRAFPPARLARRYIFSAKNKAGGLRLVFDVEADNLLNAATKIYCIVVEDLDSDRIDEFGPGQPDDALARLSQANCL